MVNGTSDVSSFRRYSTYQTTYGSTRKTLHLRRPFDLQPEQALMPALVVVKQQTRLDTGNSGEQLPTLAVIRQDGPSQPSCMIVVTTLLQLLL
jgi:hypothetical protein